jgi:hypothetical protein
MRKERDERESEIEHGQNGNLFTILSKKKD